ncbi:MAG: hypothetical protein HC903_22145 [Methylacidiphilales bacterium]|nr:hypothetical protein [Candidatus Methylacidiphilales bacterium]
MPVTYRDRTTSPEKNRPLEMHINSTSLVFRNYYSQFVVITMTVNYI